VPLEQAGQAKRKCSQFHQNTGPSDKHLSDCLIFVLSDWIPTSVWAVGCFKSSSASINKLDRFEFG